MKICRKWRRAWKRDKPTFRQRVTKKRKATKAPSKSSKIAKITNKIIKAVPALGRVAVATGVALSVFTTVNPGYAMPSGGSVTAGEGTITQNGSAMTVNQTTNKLALNWQNFGIGQGEKVQFIQPNAQSVALNRVIGNDASKIYGQLTANGQVFLINPNGILFSKTAQVNVGGIVASSLQLSDSDFMNGKYIFTKNGTAGSVINQGNIQTTDGGYAALLGNKVSNEGVIIANKGSIGLGAGDKATLDFTGDGLINLTVNQSAIDAQAANSNLLQANGGLVVMTAKAAGDLTGTVVNNSGVIRAQSLAERNGKIVLDGGTNGVTQVAGTLDVSAANSSGGTISVTGEKVLIGDNTRLDATGTNGGGEIYVGGGWQGSGDISHATNTTIASTAILDASATDKGNGGTVVVWSDELTNFAGTINAKGSQIGGDGGAVETSSKGVLQVSGNVQASSTNGKAGSWLLDPRNVTIDSSGNTINGFDPSTSGTSQIDVATINAALNNNTNVTVTTTTTAVSGWGEVGRITVASEILKSSGVGSATLTLQAENYIDINAPIHATSGILNLTLDAAQDVTQSASGVIGVNGLRLLNGNFTLTNLGNSITTLAASNAGLVNVMSGSSMTIGTVGSTQGLTSRTSSELTVTAPDGLLTINQPVAVGAGYNLSLKADRMSINDDVGTVAATTTILPYSVGRTIDIGSITDSAVNTLELSAVEFSRFKNSSSLKIGDVNTGAISISQAIARKDNSAASAGLILTSGATIIESGGSIVADSLVANANNAVTLNGANVVNYFASNSNNHDIQFHDVLPTGGILSVYPIGGLGGPYSGINAGSGNITLTVDGDATVVNMGSSITANGLALIAPTSRFYLYGIPGIDLTINTIAGNIGTAAIGAKNSFSIGTVGSTVGLTSNGVTVAGVLKSGLGLESGGTITQTTPISAIDLYLGRGDFTLTNPSNHVQTLTTYSYTNDNNASTGNISYRDNGALVINTAYNNINASGSVALQADSISIPLGDSTNLNVYNAGEAGVVDGAGIIAGTSVTLKANTNINLSSNITATGDVLVNANTTGAGGNIMVSGANIAHITTINSNGHNITLSGGADPTTGYAVGDNGNKSGINLSFANLNAGAGNILLRGKGLYGTAIDNSSTVSTTTGNITLVGQGMGNVVATLGDTTTAASIGVSIAGTSLVQSTSGAIALTGSGDKTVATNRNFGISLYGGNIASSGGNITLTGTAGGGATTTGNYGIYIDEMDATSGKISTIKSLAGSGAITLTGTGRGSDSAGVLIQGLSSLNSTQGKITITGTDSGQGAGQNNIFGVKIYRGPSIVNTTGDIEIVGNAKFNPDTPLTEGQSTGNYHIGVSINSYHANDGTPTSIQAGGTITITGTGGGFGSNDVNGNLGTSYFNDGVDVNSRANITSPVAITVTGTAGDGSNAWATDASTAVYVMGGAIQATGAGTVSIIGNGGSSSKASYNHGVILISDNGDIGKVTSEDGNISITGHGSGQFSSGVIMRNDSQLTSTGAGNITILGTTFSGTATADGTWINVGLGYYKSSSDTIAVRLSNTSKITASNGNISITGNNITDRTNSPTNVASSIGINTQSGVIIKTTGSGNITLTGTGGGIPGSTLNIGINNYGKILAEGSGNITISGTAGPAVDDTTPFGNVDWGGYSNFGVYIGGNSEFGGPWGDLARIKTNSGNIKITGTNDDTHVVHYLANNGNGQPQLGNYALFIDTQSDINAGGQGTITLEGKGVNGSVMLNMPVNAGLGRNGITTAGQEIRVSGTTSIELLREVDSSSAVINSNGGNVTLNAGTDITLNGIVSSTGGNIILAAGRNFINNIPSNTGIASGSGRYFVYSANPADSIEGMTSYNKHYNQTYTAGSTPSYASSGNWFFYSLAPVVDVTPDTQTVTYGTAPSITAQYTGFIDGDTAGTAGISGTAAFSVGGAKSTSNNYTAGSHDVSYTNGLLSSLGYQFQDKTASTNELTVNAKVISTSGAAAQNKTYDGTTAATISVATLNGVLLNDSVTTNGSGTFNEKNVGTQKNVTATMLLTGTDGGNYQLIQPTGLVADIGKATLVANLTGTVSKVYDGNTNAILSTGNYSLSGVASGDAVTLSSPTSGTYDSKNAGANKTVTVSGLGLSGTDTGNYQLAFTSASGAVGQIDKATLIAGLTGTVNKVYDGTTTASLTGSNYTLAGVISGDAVNLNNPTGGTYGSGDIGTGKTVTVNGITLSGSGADNYQLAATTASGPVGVITPENTTVTTTTPPNTQDSNPRILVNQGGVNAPAIINSVTTAPVIISPVSLAVTMSRGNQSNTSSYTVDVSGNTLTIKVAGVTSGSAVTGTNSNIALVSVGTTGVQTSSNYYNVTSSSNSLTMTNVNNSTSTLLTEPSAAAASANFSMTTANGAVAEFKVMYADGAMSIHPLNEAASTMTTDEVNNKKLVTATGLLVAQENLGVNLQSVSTIYIHN